MVWNLSVYEYEINIIKELYEKLNKEFKYVMVILANVEIEKNILINSYKKLRKLSPKYN